MTRTWRRLRDGRWANRISVPRREGPIPMRTVYVFPMRLQKQIHFAFFAKLDLENAAIAINAAISFCDQIALCSRNLSCWRVFVWCPRAQNVWSRPIKMCVRRQTVWLWSISHRLIESTDVEERCFDLCLSVGTLKHHHHHGTLPRRRRMSTSIAHRKQSTSNLLNALAIFARIHGQ